MNAEHHRFVLTTAREGEPALVTELAQHGLTAVPSGRGYVELEGTLEDGYRAALWSRIASRVLLPMGVARAEHADALYASVRRGPWEDHLDPDRTFAVHVVGTNRDLRHEHFTALRVKDAIVDLFRERTGARPDVERNRPDVMIHVRITERDAILSIDLSGGPLHQRGRGRDGGPAPLRETLAAAMLVFADWPTLCKQGVPLVDPFCGSGTLLREAAGMALDRAPGLHRRHWGFLGWPGHDEAAWDRLLDEAQTRALDELPCAIHGSDVDGRQLNRARNNLDAYELEGIELSRRAFDGLPVPPGRSGEPRGLIVTNPPYGERLGDDEEAVALWRGIGDRLRREWLGWDAWLLAGSKPLGKELGLRPKRRIPIRNGPLDARLLHVPISAEPLARFAKDSNQDAG